jgi:hypothetical protein
MELVSFSDFDDQIDASKANAVMQDHRREERSGVLIIDTMTSTSYFESTFVKIPFPLK